MKSNELKVFGWYGSRWSNRVIILPENEYHPVRAKHITAFGNDFLITSDKLLAPNSPLSYSVRRRIPSARVSYS